MVKTALEINADILEFIQTHCQQTGGAASQAGVEEEFNDDMEEPEGGVEDQANLTEK